MTVAGQILRRRTTTANLVEEIGARRRADVLAQAATADRTTVEAAAAAAPPTRAIAERLAASGVHLIAEIKRASPSAGDITPDARPAVLARAYEAGGASAVSVLTEPDHFRGSLDDLREARSACGLPVLRKDFLCDPLHLWEARAAGADAVLLIVAALTQTELVSLSDLAADLDMAALVEAHSATDVDRAVQAGARLVLVLRPFLVPAGAGLTERGRRHRDHADEAAGEHDLRLRSHRSLLLDPSRPLSPARVEGSCSVCEIRVKCGLSRGARGSSRPDRGRA